MAARIIAPVSAHAEVAAKPAALSEPAAFYNFMHGDVQVTMVSDGVLGLGDGRKLIKEATVEDLTTRLEAAFLPADNMVLQQNIPVLKIGGKTIIVDTGTGTATFFGDTTGRLPANLKAAGIDPASIDMIVLSHCHPDHLGGMIDGAGKVVFPNAQVSVNEADFNFWTDEAKLTGEIKPFIEFARARLLPYKDKISFHKGGQDIVSGLQAIDAPGHTVGHTMFMVTSGAKPLAITADCAHHYILFVEKPKIEFGYDTDSKLAVATRLKVWDMLATDRIPFIAYHFPWPGLGNLAKAGDAYRYYQTPVVL
ncbi:MAG TPA: MBL fold metallo-hydrolase [Hyphomicrobium sp.]|nr:MBL fold metallo-hydrolase [Hyphomicrobium sp.]